MNVVILSHAHPNFSKGGGEAAAYNLWQGINDQPEHRAWFVGRVDQQLLNVNGNLAAVGDYDYLIGGNAGIRDLTATVDMGPDSELAQLLKKIQPDVVHFHHYLHIGIEIIRLVKRVCPQARVVVTLHEFVAICMNDGQMVKTDGSLCYRAGPRECQLCFPHITQREFFLREMYIKSFFYLVDLFISPSEFLRKRYIAWGIESSRIAVLENGLPEADAVPPRIVHDDEHPTRFGYFGQITPYKGIDVILEAFVKLSAKQQKQVSLDIFGSGLNNQSPEFVEDVRDLAKRIKGTINFHGPYEPQEMPQLMRGIDWIIMGSKWWENSPLVIQEAFKYGRPIITPDIGGMAEKVKPGHGGLTYRARDSLSLASVIKRTLNEPELFERLCNAMPAYPHAGEVAKKHLAVYDDLRTTGYKELDG